MDNCSGLTSSGTCKDFGEHHARNSWHEGSGQSCCGFLFVDDLCKGKVQPDAQAAPATDGPDGFIFQLRFTGARALSRWRWKRDMGMDQYLLIPFLVGWTSIYQLFWGSPGVQGFDPHPYLPLAAPLVGITVLPACPLWFMWLPFGWRICWGLEGRLLKMLWAMALTRARRLCYMNTPINIPTNVPITVIWVVSLTIDDISIFSFQHLHLYITNKVFIVVYWV